MRRHQDAKVKHFDVSNVIYHKFSNGAVSYTLNGENVNVMLEFDLFGDASFHFYGVSRCNDVFSHQKLTKYYVNASIKVEVIGGISLYVMA